MINLEVHEEASILAQCISLKRLEAQLKDFTETKPLQDDIQAGLIAVLKEAVIQSRGFVYGLSREEAEASIK